MTAPARNAHRDPDINDLWERTGEALARLGAVEAALADHTQQLERIEAALADHGAMLRAILARLPEAG